MELTIAQALQHGMAAHKEGKLQDAERLYRAILQVQPNHPDANHNLGVLAVAVGKTHEAIPLFKLALDANPQIEQFWLSYIETLTRLERFDEANRILVDGEKAGVSSNKLDALKQRLQGPAPIAMTETAKGQVFLEKVKGQGSSLSAAPSQDQLKQLLGHHQAGRLAEAEALASSLSQQFPDQPVAWKVLGAVLLQTGRAAASLLPIQKSVALSPHDAEAHSNLGATLQALARQDQAEASYRQAIALKPDYAEAHYNLGHLFQEQDRLDEATASYRQAIALKPDFVEAHRNLWRTKKFASRDEQFSQMQELYQNPAISENQRCQICFALARASEDLGDIAGAFLLYAEGNALRKKQLGYDRSQDDKLFEKLKANYPRIVANRHQSEIAVAEPSPIFIVGMPRSGTTLVEQIISSHPLVTGAGELLFAGQFGGKLAVGGFPEITRGLQTFREQYLNHLRECSEGKAIVTDKMPQNFRWLGVIAAALPEAKIIHVKRDSAAVCWANYTQHFVTDALGYCYDLDDILHYHDLYQDLMVFWQKALPDRIYHLDYEVLTECQEEETRKLINHLGLSWDDACLSPQDNKRRVTTASMLQVRQAVYQRSSERWKRYRPFLEGALDHFSAGEK